MKQAKVLNETEMKRLLAVIGAGKHAARNRLAVMLSNLAGLRVGEIASLKYGEVFADDGSVRDQFTLKSENTKAGEARAVFVGNKLKKELCQFQKSLKTPFDPQAPLLMTQKRTAFSGNTLCQLFGQLYSKAGIDGASSHSGRRSFITKLAHNGISAKVIMELAGHKNLGTTQRYIEVNDEMKRAAVEAI